MRKIVLLTISILAACSNTFGQTLFQNETDNKGKFYIYWGWNGSSYTKSDIELTGDDYNFTLENVHAQDRQSPFNFDTYFNPTTVTIPQYNFRMGYFFNSHYSISIGVDHMKYVVPSNQRVKMSGTIMDTSSEFFGVHDNSDVQLSSRLLQFEHTDGLNYANVELRRFDKIFEMNKIDVNLITGFGAGVLIPRTNAAVLNRAKYDEFHLAGFGMAPMVGINITFYDIFFLQTEWKGGYINMPDIRTNASESDRASQDFFFSQFNGVFGAVFEIN